MANVLENSDLWQYLPILTPSANPAMQLSGHSRNTSTFQLSKHKEKESPRKTSRTNARKWQTENLLDLTRFKDTSSNISPACMKDWHNNSQVIVSWMIPVGCHHGIQPEQKDGMTRKKDTKGPNRQTTDRSCLPTTW